MFKWLLQSRLVWLGAVFISFITWGVPAAWLADAVRDYAWLNFTGRLSGSVGSRALLLGCCWTLLVGWILWANYAKPASILKYLGLAGLVVFGGASLIAVESLAAQEGFVPNGFVDAAMGLGVLLLEVLLSILIGKKLFRDCFAEGQFLGYLRVIAIGFTGLMAIKLGLFLLMPGTHVRLSSSLLGG